MIYIDWLEFPHCGCEIDNRDGEYDIEVYLDGHECPVHVILPRMRTALSAMYIEFGENFPVDERIAVDLAREALGIKRE